MEFQSLGSRWLYFITPGISAFLVGFTYIVLKKYYRPPREHYLLHFLCWITLFVPQMMVLFFCGLNIIYSTWTFITATSAAGAVLFQDFALPSSLGTDRESMKFVFEELKFYLDRLAFAWVALGTITGVAMSILWQGPQHSFTMQYNERVLWAVYMVLCFIEISFIALFFTIIPIYRRILTIRENYIR